MTAPETLQAFIIDRHRFKSSSIIAEAVTDRGTLSMLCRGATKDGAGAELSRVALLTVIIAPGRDLSTLVSAAINRDHPAIHASALKLAAVSCLASLVKAARTGDDARTFTFVDAALAAIEDAPEQRQVIDSMLASSILKLLYISGVLPKLDSCVVCDAPFSRGYFSFVRGGYVCGSCADSNEKKTVLSQAMQHALRELIHLPVAEAYGHLHEDIPGALTGLIRRTFAAYAGSIPKAVKAYDEIAAAY